MLWTMMYIYGNLDYPVVVVSDLRIKSNESLGQIIKNNEAGLL